MPTNRHRSRLRRANSRAAKWWQCFITSLQISDSSDSGSELEFVVENTTAAEYEDDPQPQPWPPPPPPPSGNILLTDNTLIPSPPPPPFPFYFLSPSSGPNRGRNESSSPPFLTPAPPVRSPPAPPRPLRRLGPRSTAFPTIRVGENSLTSSHSRFPSGGSAIEYWFPVEPSPPVERRLKGDTRVNSAMIKVKISEDYNKRDEPHCPICREEYKVGEEAAILHCCHAFHLECVVSWLDNHKTCPVCRREVEAPPRDEWEINILESRVTNTLLEEEIEENNNENVNSDEAEIPDIEETQEAADSNTTSDSDETDHNSARDELDESHG